MDFEFSTRLTELRWNLSPEAHLSQVGFLQVIGIT